MLLITNYACRDVEHMYACLIPPRGTSLLYGITHQGTVDPEETCQGPHITQYQISFQTGSTVNTKNVSTSGCTAGRCSYTFEPPSNPPSSYDSVSVAAENVVGVGAARTCTTQTISEFNFISVRCINPQHKPLVSC